MQQLKTLIRLHKLQVDERRRILADLRAMEDRLQEEKRRLAEEVEREKQVAGESLVVSLTFSAFLKQAKLRRENLDRSIAKAREEIAKAEDDLAAAFQELKRYELAQEDRERRAAAERKRRETQAFDEVGAERFRRAQDAGE